MTSTGFRRSAIALAIVALAGCSTWDRMTKNEQATTVGAASGAVGGAVVGGPVGAVAGGAIGGVAGHELAKSDSAQAASANSSRPGSAGNKASSSAAAEGSSATGRSDMASGAASADASGNASSNDMSDGNARNVVAMNNPPPSSGSGAQGVQVMSRDEYLRRVQQSLNDQGYNAGPVDGIWGPKTAAALKEFQGDHGLETNGHIDAQTISALGIAQPAESNTTRSATSTTAGASPSSEQTASAGKGMGPNSTRPSETQ
jgi:osmotically inducible lipoprotein OsmB